MTCQRIVTGNNNIFKIVFLHYKLLMHMNVHIYIIFLFVILYTIVCTVYNVHSKQFENIHIILFFHIRCYNF